MEVTLDTTEAGGIHGPAGNIPLTTLGITQGGIFWFFSATNPEMLIKVIDACAFNNRVWVFFAALTDAGFAATVTDTQTGHFKTYTNPDHTTAKPTQDTGALVCN